MTTLKAKLLEALRQIEGVEDRPSPVAGGTALLYRGKEFAHFHHDGELDLRLTKPLIRSLGLSHPADSVYHPARSPNSAWIEVRFSEPGDIDEVTRLVRLAVAER